MRCILLACFTIYFAFTSAKPVPQDYYENGEYLDGGGVEYPDEGGNSEGNELRDKFLHDDRSDDVGKGYNGNDDDGAGSFVVGNAVKASMADSEKGGLDKFDEAMMGTGFGNTGHTSNKVLYNDQPSDEQRLEFGERIMAKRGV